MSTLQVPPAFLIFGLTCFLKGNLFAGFSLQLTPIKDRAQHTPGCDTHSLHRNQPWDSLLVLLIFYPTMMLSAPALCQLHGNHWIYKFPSLPSASFGADPALLVHLLLFPKAISISKGLIHAASQGHSHFTDPLIYSHYSNNQKPG